MARIKIFRYLDDLDCFVVSDKYRVGAPRWLGSPC